jgi:hypothetical protein
MQQSLKPAGILHSLRSGDPQAERNDPDALYVWAGVTGPMRGGWEAYRASPHSTSLYPEIDWVVAIGATVEEAYSLGISRVYVIDNV